MPAKSLEVPAQVLGRVPPKPCSGESFLSSRALLGTGAAARGCPWAGLVPALPSLEPSEELKKGSEREDVGLELPDRGGV